MITNENANDPTACQRLPSKVEVKVSIPEIVKEARLNGESKARILSLILRFEARISNFVENGLTPRALHTSIASRSANGEIEIFAGFCDIACLTLTSFFHISSVVC